MLQKDKEMKIHNHNEHGFKISTCFFFILALCISSAVLCLSTHMVILQVSLGVGTWLSLPLFLSAPGEPKRGSRKDFTERMVVTDIMMG